MGDLLGYARVSTLEQNSRLQTDALKSAGCYRVFTNIGPLRRPRARQALRPGAARRYVVVWRLDRLGRSLRHLIDTVNALSERKIGFRSLTENIDTSTSGGSWCSTSSGALAEFERELIRERTRPAWWRRGLVVARRQADQRSCPPTR